MKRLVFIYALLIIGVANGQAPFVRYAEYEVWPYYPPVPTPEVQVFDQDFFNRHKRHRPSYSPEGRIMESPPDFSEARRNSWIHQCKMREPHSFKRFRACYENEVSRYEASKLPAWQR